MMIENFSDYIVYVDESGDHHINKYDPKYPIFVLAFCVFHKADYLETVKQVQALKFQHFGHDMVILHEREILKSEGMFKHLNKETQNKLLNDLTILIQNAKFTVISCVIRKDELPQLPVENLYHLAVQFGLQRLYQFLQSKNQLEKQTFVVFEQRGLQEDKELQQAFNHICHDNKYPFKVILASKKVNSTGLQFADLIARPIGNHVLRPKQANRAFDVIGSKLYNEEGLKIYPK